MDAPATGKLKWRCRRGVRELDILLTRFLDERYARVSSDDQASFLALLECQDPDIMDWLMGRRYDYPNACASALRLLSESRQAAQE